MTSAHEFQKLKDAIRSPWEVMCRSRLPLLRDFWDRILPFSEADDEAPVGSTVSKCLALIIR